MLHMKKWRKSNASKVFHSFFIFIKISSIYSQLRLLLLDWPLERKEIDGIFHLKMDRRNKSKSKYFLTNFQRTLHLYQSSRSLNSFTYRNYNKSIEKTCLEIGKGLWLLPLAYPIADRTTSVFTFDFVDHFFEKKFLSNWEQWQSAQKCWFDSYRTKYMRCARNFVNDAYRQWYGVSLHV